MLVLFGMIAKEIAKTVAHEMEKKKNSDDELSIQEFLHRENVSSSSYASATTIMKLYREDCCSNHISRVLKIPKREVEAIISRFDNN